MAPLAPDVSEGIGDLLIVESFAERGHSEFPFLAFNRECIARAMEDHPDDALLGTQGPFGIAQRRSLALLSVAMRLMAGTANRRVKFFAPIKAFLLRRRKG